MRQILHNLANLLLTLLELYMTPLTAFMAVYKELKIKFFGRSLKNKVVLITGASSGLGSALAREFYNQGCRIIMAARNVEKLEEVKKKIIADTNPGTVSVPCVLELDVSKSDLRLEAVLEIYGHVDIVVNNAGISMRGSVHETPMEAHKRIMDVNYFGMVAITRGLLTSLKSRCDWSSLVNISSLQGLVAVPNRSAYSASKHALQAFSDSLRAELDGENGSNKVQVLVVSPGYINTNLSMNALTPSLNPHGKMDKTTSSGYSPLYVAKLIRESVQLGHNELLVAPWHHNLAIYIRRFWPRLYFWAVAMRAKADMAKDSSDETESAKLDDTGLNGASSDEPKMEETNLKETNLDKDSLEETTLDKTNEEETSCDETNLKEANLRSLEETNLNKANLNKEEKRESINEAKLDKSNSDEAISDAMSQDEAALDEPIPKEIEKKLSEEEVDGAGTDTESFHYTRD